MSKRASAAASVSARVVSHWIRKVSVLFALSLTASLVPLYAVDQTIHPEDFGCVGDGVTDDTACWELTLDAAHAPGGNLSLFGSIEARSRAHYVISNTLLVHNSFGGVINGNGAHLEWRAAPGGCNSAVPMFLLQDTQQLKIENLVVTANSGCKLQTAFEFTNYNESELDPSWAPSLNILDNVRVDGTGWGGLDYGVRFSLRYGVAQMNDQSTIRDSAFQNVAIAAISIEHPNSKNHRFLNVSGFGADSDGNPNNGSQNSASLIRLEEGSFSSFGGFAGGFGDAVFYIDSVYDPITIVDSNSEGCGTFLKTPGGNAWFPVPVNVTGGRYFPHPDNPTGAKVVDWNRMGPVTIRGMQFELPHHEVLSFTPPPPLPGTTTHGLFEVIDCLFHPEFPGGDSTTWDQIAVNDNARVVSHGNMCGSTTLGALPCRGIAGGAPLSTGIVFAQLVPTPPPTVPDANGATTYCKDCSAAPGTGACQGGGAGAFARRVAGTWRCEGSEVLLEATQSLKSKTLTDASNVFPPTAVLGFAVVNPGTSQRYGSPNNGFNDAAESNVATRVPAMKARNLYCRATAGPGSGKTWTVTLRDDSTSTALTCNISATATSCQDTSNVVTIVAGSLVALEVKRTAGSGSMPSSTFSCSVETTPNGP